MPFEVVLPVARRTHLLPDLRCSWIGRTTRVLIRPLMVTDDPRTGVSGDALGGAADAA